MTGDRTVSRRTFAASVGLGLAGSAGLSHEAKAAPGPVATVDDLVAGRAFASDSLRLQAALDEAAGRGVRRLAIPPKAGGYLLTTPIVVPAAAAGLEIEGAGPAGELLCRTDGAAIVVQAHRVGLSGLFLSGGGRLLKQTGVLFRKARNVDDVDAAVSDCQFSDFATAVAFEGRGLRFSDNRIVSCGTGARLDWPEGVSEADPVLQRLPYGYRKITLFRNYGHNVSVMFRNVSRYPIVGAQISDNHVDVGRSFWFGAISHSIIGPNVARNCRSVPIFIAGESSGLRISGLYGGLPEPPGDEGGGATHQPNFGLYFRGEAKCLILDVSLTDLAKGGVVFAKSVDGADVRIAYDAEAAGPNDRFVHVRGDAAGIFMTLVFPRKLKAAMGVRIDGELTDSDLSALAHAGVKAQANAGK